VTRPGEQQTDMAQTASSELVKLIRKLRWIGMDEEAQGLQKELEQRQATECVLATPRETD
jgi:hypothetical protein